MAENDSLSKYLSTAVDAAKKAGEIIRKGFYLKKNVEHKGTVDLVTETDKACEDLIFNHLKEQYPTHKFIGEETSAANGTSELTDEPTWIVDPLDGTTNFVHGFPFLCVSIGLTIEKVPTVGVVYNPIMNELYTGIRGKGAFLNGDPIKVSSQSELVTSLLATDAIRSRDILLAAAADLPDFHTAVPSSDFEALKGELEAERERSRTLTRQLDESEERHRASMGVEAQLTTRLSTTSCMLKQEQAECAKAIPKRDKLTVDSTTNRINSLLYKVRSLRMCGSCALDLCSIACGRVDLFYLTGFGGPWDVAGGAVIVTEAGGLVFDPSGKDFDITSQRVAASNPLVKDAFVEALQESE